MRGVQLRWVFVGANGTRWLLAGALALGCSTKAEREQRPVFGLRSLDLATGRARWFNDVESPTDLLFSSDRVELRAATMTGGQTLAFDFASGSRVEPRSGTTAFAQELPLATNDDYLFLAQADGSAVRIARSDPSDRVAYRGTGASEMVTQLTLLGELVVYQTAPMSSDANTRDAWPGRRLYVARLNDAALVLERDLEPGDEYSAVGVDTGGSELLVKRFDCAPKGDVVPAACDPNSRSEVVLMDLENGVERSSMAIPDFNSASPFVLAGSEVFVVEIPGKSWGEFVSFQFYELTTFEHLFDSNQRPLASGGPSAWLFGAHTKALSLRDVHTRSVVWQRRTRGEILSVSSDDTTAFVLMRVQASVSRDANDTLCALALSDGQERWCRAFALDSQLLRVGKGSAFVYTSAELNDAAGAITASDPSDGAAGLGGVEEWTSPAGELQTVDTTEVCVGELPELLSGFGAYQGCPSTFDGSDATFVACTASEYRLSYACDGGRTLLTRGFGDRARRKLSCIYSSETREPIGALLEQSSPDFCAGRASAIQAGEVSTEHCVTLADPCSG